MIYLPNLLMAVLVQTFIKVVNYQHLMPTRYTLEVDLKNLVTPEALETGTKRKETRKVGLKHGLLLLPPALVIFAHYRLLCVSFCLSAPLTGKAVVYFQNGTQKCSYPIHNALILAHCCRHAGSQQSL